MTGRAGRERGQSEVLGTVLLLGIVIIASASVAALALGAFSGTQDQAEDRAIEQALLDLRSAAIDVGVEGEARRTLLLEPPADSQLRVDDAGARFKVIHVGYDTDKPDAEEVLYDTTLGSVTISEDDRTYAFEGGGIFRRQDGRTTLVAPPPIAYRGLTANLAVIKLEGSGSKGGPTNVGLSPGERILPAFPNTSTQYENGSSPLTYDNPVENGSLKLVIESTYYRGWADFFEQRATGSVTVDAPNETVIVDLESVTELVHDSAITHQNGFNTHGNPTVDGEVEEASYMVDSRDIVQSEVEDASSSNDNEGSCINETTGFDSPCTLSPGTYFINGSETLSDDIDINATGGDVKLVVDGDFDIANNEIVITEGSGNVEYYINGDFAFQGNAYIGTSNEEIEAYRNALVIAEGLQDDTSGGGTVELDAIIYAPNADVDVSGNLHINGAIYSRSISLGGNDQVVYDPSIEDHPLDLTAGSTPVMFLHITQNNVQLAVS